jgi:apolipoprotein N-acyltransferase
MKVRDIFPLIGSSLLLALAFPNTGIWPLAYVGLVPLLLWLPDKGYGRAFLGGMLTGMVFYVITFAWFASLTYWAGGIVLLGVSLLFIFFSLFWGAIAVGYRFFLKWMPGGVVIAFPAMWVLMEYIHNRIFTGFGWGSLGYTQWNNLPVAQLASIGSIYMVSFYIVIINVLIYLVVRYIGRWTPGLAAAGAIIFLGVAVPIWGKMRIQTPDMSSSLRVGVIQPNFSLDVKWGSEYAPHMFGKQKLLTEKVVAKGAELVVWPESALYGFLVDEIAEIAAITRSNDIYLLTGSNHYRRVEKGSENNILYYNSAFLINPDGEIMDRYDKRHLAPFGEYVPLREVLPFIGKIVPQIGDFSPGKDAILFNIGEKKFCVLICFENSFPHLVRESARLGADFLVQLTNDGWFGRTSQPGQDLAIAVFRSIENGMTLVRGTNTGISCFIDAWGRISDIVHAPWGEILFIRGESVETISTVAHDTFYKDYGDVWVLICCLLLAPVFGACLYRRKLKLDKFADKTGEGGEKQYGTKKH